MENSLYYLYHLFHYIAFIKHLTNIATDQSSHALLAPIFLRLGKVDRFPNFVWAELDRRNQECLAQNDFVAAFEQIRTISQGLDSAEDQKGAGFYNALCQVAGLLTPWLETSRGSTNDHDRVRAKLLPPRLFLCSQCQMANSTWPGSIAN